MLIMALIISSMSLPKPTPKKHLPNDKFFTHQICQNLTSFLEFIELEQHLPLHTSILNYQSSYQAASDSVTSAVTYFLLPSLPRRFQDRKALNRLMSQLSAKYHIDHYQISYEEGSIIISKVNIPTQTSLLKVQHISLYDVRSEEAIVLKQSYLLQLYIDCQKDQENPIFKMVIYQQKYVLKQIPLAKIINQIQSLILNIERYYFTINYFCLDQESSLQINIILHSSKHQNSIKVEPFMTIQPNLQKLVKFEQIQLAIDYLLFFLYLSEKSIDLLQKMDKPQQIIYYEVFNNQTVFYVQQFPPLVMTPSIKALFKLIFTFNTTYQLVVNLQFLQSIKCQKIQQTSWHLHKSNVNRYVSNIFAAFSFIFNSQTPIQPELRQKMIKIAEIGQPKTIIQQFEALTKQMIYE